MKPREVDNAFNKGSDLCCRHGCHHARFFRFRFATFEPVPGHHIGRPRTVPSAPAILIASNNAHVTVPFVAPFFLLAVVAHAPAAQQLPNQASAASANSGQPHPASYPRHPLSSRVLPYDAPSHRQRGGGSTVIAAPLPVEHGPILKRLQQPQNGRDVVVQRAGANTASPSAPCASPGRRHCRHAVGDTTAPPPTQRVVRRRHRRAT